MTDLELRFHKAMIGIYEAAKDECQYNATRFLRMLSEKGGLATARTLISTFDPTIGFTALWECQRLDLTVEAHVIRPEFASLFTEEEISMAQRRLEDYGYKFAFK